MRYVVPPLSSPPAPLVPLAAVALSLGTWGNGCLPAPEDPTDTSPPGDTADRGNAALVFDPAQPDFGEVYPTCSAALSLEAENEGTVDLVIHGVDTDLDSAVEIEVATGINGSFPWTLVPGQRVDMAELTFQPEAELTEPGSLIFTSTDPDSPTTLTLLGQAAYHEDVFELDAPRIDLVFGVASTDKMVEYVDTFIDALEPSLDVLNDSQNDWQLAAIWDPETGCLCADAPVSGSTEQPADAVAAMLAWDDTGRDDAPLFDMLDAGLSDSALEEGACNEGLLRDGAHLHVVGFSNIPDTSAEEWTTYRDTWADRVGSSDLLTFHGIGVSAESSGGDVSCDTENALESFQGAAEETGGVFVDLCASDWTDQLESLASAMVEALPGGPFALSEVPVEETLSVEVNGECAEGWTWNEGSNTISFDSSVRPELNDVVTVRYTPEGACD